MLLILLILSGLLASSPPSSRPTEAEATAVGTTAADTLRALYEGGRSFSDFLEGARSRRGQWRDHYAAAVVTSSVLDRARALGGPWRLLVVAEDWCGDSVNTIPYLAKLVDGVDGLEMRVIDSRVGRPLMEAHRTPDGRPATPTLLLLDGDWNLAGCMVERPGPLVSWYQENRAEKSSEELHEYLYAWYDRDQGATTVSEVVGLVAAARAGAPLCPGGTEPPGPAPPSR